MNYAIVEGGDWQGDTNLTRVRIGFERRIAPRFAVVAGVSANVFVSQESDGADLAPWTLWKHAGGTNVRLWPGVFIGARI